MESENEPSLYSYYNYHLIYYSILYIIGEVLLEFLFGKPVTHIYTQIRIITR